MSYDIHLVDEQGQQVYLETPHQITGGTYVSGGTPAAWLNITYNYWEHFQRVFGEKRIRVIYGMRAVDSIPLLEKAAEQLADDVDPNYWKPTEGNAKAAIINLIKLAKLAPEAIWQGD
jgi:hypothetical protein